MDLAITNSGDIIFKPIESIFKDLKIQFNISKAPVLKIKFDINNSIPIQTNLNNKLKISFDCINNINGENSSLLLDDYNALIQRIKIIINTSLNEVEEREDIGTKLEYLKHEKFLSQNNIQTTKEYITEAIEDILPNAIIKIYPDNSNYKHYYNIYIYNNNEELIYNLKFSN